jgi:hypothetical protein
MNKTNELPGTPVLVHPDLLFDTAGRQGQVGMITDTDLARDEVFVSFERGQNALYSTNALLVLKPSNEIHREALGNHLEIDTRDFKALLEISLLTQSGQSSKIRSALEMAGANDTLRKYSFQPLEDSLGLAKTESQYAAVHR